MSAGFESFQGVHAVFCRTSKSSSFSGREGFSQLPFSSSRTESLVRSASLGDASASFLCNSNVEFMKSRLPFNTTTPYAFSSSASSFSSFSFKKPSTAHSGKDAHGFASLIESPTFEQDFWPTLQEMSDQNHVSTLSSKIGSLPALTVFSSSIKDDQKVASSPTNVDGQLPSVDVPSYERVLSPLESNDIIFEREVKSYIARGVSAFIDEEEAYSVVDEGTNFAMTHDRKVILPESVGNGRKERITVPDVSTGTVHHEENSLRSVSFFSTEEEDSSVVFSKVPQTCEDYELKPGRVRAKIAPPSFSGESNTEMEECSQSISSLPMRIEGDDDLFDRNREDMSRFICEDSERSMEEVMRNIEEKAAWTLRSSSLPDLCIEVVPRLEVESMKEETHTEKRLSPHLDGSVEFVDQEKVWTAEDRGSLREKVKNEEKQFLERSEDDDLIGRKQYEYYEDKTDMESFLNVMENALEESSEFFGTLFNTSG